MYYALLREPTLDAATFGRRYYRWLAWRGWQVLRQPGRVLTYWLHRHDETHPETFDTMRHLRTLGVAFTGRAEAGRIFDSVKKLQQRLQAAARQPGSGSTAAPLSPVVRV